MADWKPKKFIPPKKRTPIKTPGQAGADAFSEALAKTSFLLNPPAAGIQEPGILERGISKEKYEQFGGDPSKGDEQYSWTAPAPKLTGDTPGNFSEWSAEAIESGKHVLSALGEVLKPLDSSPASWATMENPGIGFLKKLNALNTVVSTPFTVVDQALRINPEGATVSNLVRGMFEGLSWGKRSEFKAAFKLADEIGLSKWLSDSNIITERKQEELKAVLDEFTMGVTPLVLGGAMASLKPPKLPSKKGSPPPPPSGPLRDPSLVEIPDIREIQNPSVILAPGEKPKLLIEGTPPDLKGTPSLEVVRTNLLALRLMQDRMMLQRQALDPATLPGERTKALVQLEKTIEAETNLNLYDQVGIPKEFKEAGKNDSKPAPNTPEIQTDLGVESTVKEKTSNVSPKKSKSLTSDSKLKNEYGQTLKEEIVVNEKKDKILSEIETLEKKANSLNSRVANAARKKLGKLTKEYNELMRNEGDPVADKLNEIETKLESELLTPEEPTALKPKSEVKTSSKNNKEKDLKVPDDAKLFIENKVKKLYDEGGESKVKEAYKGNSAVTKYAYRILDALTKNRTGLDDVVGNSIIPIRTTKGRSEKTVPFQVIGDKRDIANNKHIRKVIGTAVKEGKSVIDAFGGTGRLGDVAKTLGAEDVTVNFIPVKHSIASKLGTKEFASQVSKAVEHIRNDKSGVVTYLKTLPEDVGLYIANNIGRTSKEITDLNKFWDSAIDVSSKRLTEIVDIAKKKYPHKISSKDGWEVLAEAKSGDVVFVDPPYHGTRSHYGTAAKNDNLPKVKAIKEASERGVKVIYFDNYDPKLTKSLRDAGLATNVLQRSGSKLKEIFAHNIKPYLTGEKSLVEPGTMGVFGGQLGKSFKAKEKAGELIDNPTEPGKLYEISDRHLRLKDNIEKQLAEGKRGDDSFKIKDRLKNLVVWDTLFEEYPMLKDSVMEIKAFGKADEDIMPALTKGSYNEHTKEVTLYTGTKSGYQSYDFLDTLVHEIQHRISHEEGLHFGASTDTIFDAMYRDINNIRELQKNLRTVARENFLKKRKGEEVSFESRSQEADLNAVLKDARSEFKRKYKVPASLFQVNNFNGIDVSKLQRVALKLYRSTPGELLAELSAQRRTFKDIERQIMPPKISDLERRHGMNHEDFRSDFVTEFTRGDDSAKEMKSLADAVKDDKSKKPEKPKRKISAMREFPKKESGFNTFQRLTFETVNQWEPAARIARKIGIRDKSGDPTMPLSILSNRNYIASAWVKGEQAAIMKEGGWNFGRSTATIRNYLKLVKGKEQEFADFLIARRVVKDYENQRMFKENMHTAQKEFNDAKAWYDVTEKTDPLYKSRKETYDKATKKLEDAKDDYKHVSEVIKNDNFDEADALRLVKEHDGRFTKATQMYDYINRTMIDWAVNSGRLSKELGEKWKAEGSYARFRKYIEEIESTTMPKSLSKSTNQSTFRERLGSEDPVIDPVYTQAQMIHETISKGLENVFWNTMKNLADTNPELRKGFYEDPHGNLKFRIEGKEIRYYIAPEYQALAETLAPKDISKLAEFALDAGRMFVRGTTSANPIWGMLVNLPMDQLTAWTNTKFGYIPIYDAFKSFAAMKRGDANWQKFKALGGEKSTLKGLMKEDPKIFADEILKEAHSPTDWSSIKELGTKEYWKDRKFHKAKELTLNLLEMPTNLTEMATRYAEFVKAKKKGLTDTEAMYHAMNVSLPFHMTGNALGANILTKTVAYLSANINGFYRFVKSTRDQPARVGMVAASTMLAAVGATTLFKYATDEQRRLLGQKRVEDLTKAIYLPHPNGKGLIKLRIPEVVGAFTAIPTLWAIGNILGGTKAQTSDYLTALGQILPTPMQFWKGKELPMSLLPQVAKPSLEVAYNTKSYPEAMPVVPEWLVDKKPRYQYTEYTSGISRLLGHLSGVVADATGWKWTEVSPMLADHWIKAQFGTMAGYILKPSNLSDNLPVYQEEGAWALSGRAMNGFYEIKKETEQLYDEAKMKKSPLKDNLPVVKRVVLTDRVADIYSDLRAVARERGIDKLPESIKEEAYDLTVAINNDPNIEAQLDKIEALSNKAKNLVEEFNVPSATTRFYKDEFPLYLQNRLETLNPEAEEEIDEMVKDAKEIRKARKTEESKNKPPEGKKRKEKEGSERQRFSKYRN